MLKTFKLGGVIPAENKISADKSIQQLALIKENCNTDFDADINAAWNKKWVVY